MISRHRLQQAMRGSASVLLLVNAYWREANIEKQPPSRLRHQRKRIEIAVRDYERKQL